MMGLIMLIFGFSTAGQFQLEIPEFLPQQSEILNTSFTYILLWRRC